MRIPWILSRPRVLFRAWKELGLGAMLGLIRARIAGTADGRYRLRIPRFPHPIFIRGGKSTDAVALYEVLVTHEYALTADLDSPAFIIDGGANVGMASLYFLNRYPTARVVAVEPDAANLELCRLNLEPYGDRVTLLQGAIWKSGGGSLSLETGEQSWSSRVLDDQAGSIEAFSIPSLIAYGPGKVDLLKLDIEGSEGEVFGPESKEWLPKVRNIAIELHGEERKARFFEALEGYRYDLYQHRTWTDPAEGSPMNCYLATCQNLRRV